MRRAGSGGLQTALCQLFPPDCWAVSSPWWLLFYRHAIPVFASVAPGYVALLPQMSSVQKDISHRGPGLSLTSFNLITLTRTLFLSNTTLTGRTSWDVDAVGMRSRPQL